MGQESMSECELLRAEIESLKIDLQAMLGLRRTGSTSTIEKRLERVESILDARGLDWDHPRIEDDHFVGVDKMVAEGPKKEPPKKWRILGPGEVVREGDWLRKKSLPYADDPLNGPGWIDARICVGSEVVASDDCVFARPVAEEPAKEPEHPAGPKPDPGEGYRILSKDPPEELQEGDEFRGNDGDWIASNNARNHWKQAIELWYRRKIEQAEEPQAAWEPKVGDWVRVTRPEDWEAWEEPFWRKEMHVYDGRVLQIEDIVLSSVEPRAKPVGLDWFFHCDWLSPAEPEYREPVLPADAGKWCEFSNDGKGWIHGKLRGYAGHLWQSVAISEVGAKHWVHARIKKDA